MMMKAKAKAPANIAFIKYWGKRDSKLRIPMNNSVSMNLSNVYSITSVEFLHKYRDDLVVIDGLVQKGKEKDRVVYHLDRIRKIVKLKLFAKVESKNNFPKGAGIASSASGFAALTLAATKAAGLHLSEKELSILARLGSGSACRSIPDGFVEWKKGVSNASSFAHSLYPPDYWNVCDVIAIVSRGKKKVSSTKGHSLVGSSPFFDIRMKGMHKKISEITMALENKDFSKFGKIVEAEAINMHAVMMTSKPALYYWVPSTIEIINLIVEWRNNGGLESYFTLDAGPNVHIICKEKDGEEVKKRLLKVAGVNEIIVNKPTIGGRIL